jgi:hypothetical protein
MRMLVEFGYMSGELIHAEESIARETIITETVRIHRLAILDLLNE